MKTFTGITLAALLSMGFSLGSVWAADKDAAAKKTADSEAKVKAALAKFSDADRSLAEAQRFCPMMEDQRLGSMGIPMKLMIEGKPVFLCCNGCEEDALAKPKDTLAKVEKLKKRTQALAKLSASDRRLAEAQRFCPVMDESRLGSMGTPVKLMIEGKAVFLCCKACEEDALAKPKDTLAKVEKLKKRDASE